MTCFMRVPTRVGTGCRRRRQFSPGVVHERQGRGSSDTDNDDSVLVRHAHAAWFHIVVVVVVVTAGPIVPKWQQRLGPPLVGSRIVGEHIGAGDAVAAPIVAADDVQAPGEEEARRKALGFGERRADRPHAGREVGRLACVTRDRRSRPCLYSTDGVEDTLDAAE